MTQDSGGYANPQLLVDTQWLADHLNDSDIRIVDCDPREAYRRAHVPGAVCPREHYMKGPHGSPVIMEPDQFAAEMSEMGIGDDTLVVCYDQSRSLYAARFWWCLNYYGHDRCVVVNGGWNKWMQEGRPVTSLEPKPTRTTFTPKIEEEVVCRLEGLKERIDRNDVVLWDVRSKEEYEGTNDRGNKRAGHLPGAVHLEWTSCVTQDAVSLIKPAADLRTMLAGLGITPEKEVVTY